MRKPISFVVIAHENHHTLSKCLDSVEAATNSADELILVLNNPDPQTKSVADKRVNWCVVHESKAGPQHARNCGANQAKQDLLCFLDADIQITSHWVEVMTSNFQNPWVVMGQSHIEFEKDSGALPLLKQLSSEKFSSRFYHPNQEMVNLSLDTATMMVRKEWFAKVGGFDPLYSRLEDTDFSLRIMYYGGDVFYENRVAATEINDPDENFWTFLKKRYYSATYVPLLLKNHCINYYFPFYKVEKKTMSFKFWPMILNLIDLAGVANSPHSLVVTSNHWIRFLPHPKKQALGLVKNPNERSVWVGGVERTYDLLSRRFF